MSSPQNKAQIKLLVSKSLDIARRHGVEEKLLFGFLKRENFVFAQNLPVLQDSPARLIFDIGTTIEELGGDGFLSNLRSASEDLEDALSDSFEIGYWARTKINVKFYAAWSKLMFNVARNGVEIYRREVAKNQPVKITQELCVTYASVGLSALPGIISRPLYKRTMTRILKNRSEAGYSMRIVAWTINNEELLRWLATSGVDGVITDKPGIINNILRSLS